MNEDLNFLLWRRKHCKAIEESDKFVYQDTIHTPEELFALYGKLKITEVDVRGYDTFFTVQIHAEHYLTLEEAIAYVSKEIIETAMVACLRHKNYLAGRDVHLDNPLYKEQKGTTGAGATPFLKKPTEE